jgi:hypothetical protein
LLNMTVLEEKEPRPCQCFAAAGSWL